MISATNVSFSYGYEPVLQGVSFAIANGKKVGVVGPNGAGKSTLLKLLTQEEHPSEGKIEIHGVLSYVPQEVKKDPALSSAHSVEEYIDPSGKAGKFAVESVLNGLKFDRRGAAENLSDMSGGQKTKLALARAFLQKPDILLLDEPTNFLDESGKKWVMHFLGAYKKTVLIVSHDLALLDKHIQQVLYVNPDTRTVDAFVGNYTKFVKTKRQQDAFQLQQRDTTQKKIAQLEKTVGKLRAKGPDTSVRHRVILQRRLQRIKDTLPPAPRELGQIKAHFPPPASVGAVPLFAKGISKSFQGKPIIRDLTVILERGERLALIGPNGVGKTTLIKMLTGNLEPDAGFVEHSPQLDLGYYSQEFVTFNEHQSIQEVIRETHRLDSQQIYPFLSRFLFPHSRMNQRIGTLSGGEKTRLSIALLMLQQHNVLILDEPTTYLDVLSQRVILEALKAYSGSMILVSHTREFVSELAPKRALLLPEGRFRLWDDALLDRVVEI